MAVYEGQPSLRDEAQPGLAIRGLKPTATVMASLREAPCVSLGVQETEMRPMPGGASGTVPIFSLFLRRKSGARAGERCHLIEALRAGLAP